MTPEHIAENRPIRTVASEGAGTLVYSCPKLGGLYLCENSRGSFEVLIPADRHADYDMHVSSETGSLLTGFWRRRSGFHPDGQRHFIWTLVLLSAVPEMDKVAA